jgi:hypothetical protein
MAAVLLVLAVIVGVVIGDAVVANTDASSLQLFDRTITGFSLGQLLIMAAGTGFLFALLLLSSWSSSKNRRLKRRDRRDMQGRIGELERENAGLRDEADRDRRTSRLGEMGGSEGTGETTQTSRSIFPPRSPDSLDQRADATDPAPRRDAFDQADR